MDKRLLLIIISFCLFSIAITWLVIMVFQNKDLQDVIEQSNTNQTLLKIENDKLQLQISDLNEKIASLSDLGPIISAKEAARKAIDFINDNYSNTSGSAALISFQEKNGVYKVLISFNGSEYTSYVTKDGELFFTEGVNLKPAEKKEFTKTNKPVVDLFVMAFCPYGNQAETSMASIVNLFKDKISINLHYIFYSNWGDKASEYCYDEQKKYCSMHGIQELNQGIRELCVAKYAQDKLWSFVGKINQNTTSLDVDSKWKTIAAEIGIDTKKIEDCYKNEAVSLLASQVALTGKTYPVQDPDQYSGAENVKITGSPTFLINGMVYNGSRDSESIRTAICSAFKTAPVECKTALSTSSTIQNSGSCE
ncbi:MAG: hypothetical protein PHV47_01110 [Candidatus Pacebacteria bacterium]|nr:hypothetical protein [Candidatus Paceibacterota bacterium]